MQATHLHQMLGSIKTCRSTTNNADFVTSLLRKTMNCFVEPHQFPTAFESCNSPHFFEPLILRITNNYSNRCINSRKKTCIKNMIRLSLKSLNKRNTINNLFLQQTTFVLNFLSKTWILAVGKRKFKCYQNAIRAVEFFSNSITLKPFIVIRISKKN